MAIRKFIDPRKRRQLTKEQVTAYCESIKKFLLEAVDKKYEIHIDITHKRDTDEFLNPDGNWVSFKCLSHESQIVIAIND